MLWASFEPMRESTISLEVDCSNHSTVQAYDYDVILQLVNSNIKQLKISQALYSISACYVL